MVPHRLMFCTAIALRSRKLLTQAARDGPLRVLFLFPLLRGHHLVTTCLMLSPSLMEPSPLPCLLWHDEIESLNPEPREKNLCPSDFFKNIYICIFAA